MAEAVASAAALKGGSGRLGGWLPVGLIIPGSCQRGHSAPPVLFTLITCSINNVHCKNSDGFSRWAGGAEPEQSWFGPFQQDLLQRSPSVSSVSCDIEIWDTVTAPCWL